MAGTDRPDSLPPRVARGLASSCVRQGATAFVTSQPPTSAAGPTPVRVLIVEDNPHIVEMYSYVLSKLAATQFREEGGLEVCFAADGHLALAQLEERPFRLVLLDLYMPVLDGFQLIQRIRADPRHAGLPLVAISAGGEDARDRALALGADVYLKKPVRFAEVMETVKQLLHLERRT